MAFRRKPPERCIFPRRLIGSYGGEQFCSLNKSILFQI